MQKKIPQQSWTKSTLPRTVGVGVSFVILLALWFFGVTFAQLEGFGYTDATFSTGAGETSYLQTTVTAGDGSSFFVTISNPMGQDQTIMIDFFDQVLTNDGENRKSCDRVHSVDDFASTLIWDTGSFLVPANSGVTKTIDLNYNYCFSWLDLWCLMQLQTGMIDVGSFDVSLGKASFLDLQVLKDDINCSKCLVKALPAYRYGTFTMTGFMWFWIGDDFSAMSGDNSSTTGMVWFSADGTGEFVYTFPQDGSGYMALIKVPSYLSAGYTWVFDAGSSGSLDFTNFIGLDSYVYDSWWYNKIYMIDLPEVQGFSGDRSLLVAWDTNNNDYVWASDLALINYNMTVNFSPVNTNYDFDKDGYITSKDQAIMLEAVRKNGFWRYFKDILGAWLLTWDDPSPAPDQFPRSF